MKKLYNKQVQGKMIFVPSHKRAEVVFPLPELGEGKESKP